MTKKAEHHKSKIGGQALIEGVMMRGVRKSAIAVRDVGDDIKLEIWENADTKGMRSMVKKIPFLRGTFAMVDNVVVGHRSLMKSIELSGLVEEEGEGEQPSRFSQWMKNTFGDALNNAVAVIGGVVGVVLSVVLFMFLPTFVVSKAANFFSIDAFRGLLEGGVKIAIFVGYLALVRLNKEILRTFGYHGAEHKTIACFEAGDDLTVENVRRHSRVHPRCGTSFLILVLLISILVFSIVTWSSPLLRTVLKLVLLPVVVGIAYELIRLAGRHDNLMTKIISLPGIWLQHLTTTEPDEGQMEVAIAAILPVLPDNLQEDAW